MLTPAFFRSSSANLFPGTNGGVISQIKRHLKNWSIITVVSVVVFGGLWLTADNDPSRTNWLDLKPGDCVASVIGKEKLGEAVTAECNKPHLWHIVAITDYETTNFNEGIITAAVNEICEENSPSIDAELVGANADQI